SQGLLVFGVNAQQHATTRDEYLQFYQALMQKMRTIPGVESATLMANRLGSGWSSNTNVYIDGNEPKPIKGTFTGVRWNSVGPDYLRTLGVPLRLGRDI